MPKRVMMAVGGTGGHIYPAWALAEQITAKDSSIDILFAGGHLKNNPYFNKLEWPYENISCGPFNSKNLMKLGSSLSLNLQGIYESIKTIKKFKPSLIIGFGSYHSLPTLLAAKLCSVPLMLFASDCHPGKVIRLFSRFSNMTAIQFEEAAAYLKGSVKVVSMPLRKGMKKNLVSPAEAKRYYHLDENSLTLLVFGGSQGAAAINTALCQVIESKGHDWAGKLQIIHMAGKEESCAQLQHIYKNAGIKSCVKAFEDRMDMAWQACDFVLSRAGAASMAEQIEFEKPGILIPYPHAADNHQEKNGKVMKYRIGAADVIVEKEMTADRLFESISKFLDEKGHTLQQMNSALKEFKRKRQALDLCELVLNNLYTQNN